MITLYPYEELGNADHGWLNAHYHFSFSDYQNDNRRGFGVLKVINDDIIKAGTGFDTHPHRDMEIITYVRQGAITHKDSKGNEGKTKAGDVQVMSAGTGIFHSEYNLEDTDTNLYQIWIEPKELGVEPSWSAKEFPKEPVSDKLKLLVSGNKNDDALFINQDAKIYAGTLTKDTIINHNLEQQAYLLVSQGTIEIDNQKLAKGDGAEITELNTVSIKALDNAEILLIEIPKK